MIDAARTERVREALHRRLVTVSGPLLGTPARPDLPTMELLARESAAARRQGPAAQWLLFTAITALMPMRDEYLRFRRALDRAEPGLEHYAALAATAGVARMSDFLDRDIVLIDGEVVLDADFSATHGHNTGVQRVVRSTAARWHGRSGFTLSAWSGDGGIMRGLASEELERVVAWSSANRLDHSPADVEDRVDLIVPWNCDLVLIEVALARVGDRLATLAEFSGNRVSMVVHDMIPVVSAEDVVPSETDRFMQYLSVVKHAARLVGVSRSAAGEFRGFADAVAAQSIPAPEVLAVSLPIDAPNADADVAPRTTDRPLVVSVGSQEPRKNQLALLAAADLLWSDGLDFEVEFIGGSAGLLSLEFEDEVYRLQRLGRPVTVNRHASDSDLRAAYAAAAFSVMVSTHEGFGLPAGESLAAGTPVITSAHGSLAEIAAGGGCLTVDARDDLALAAAMRSLLTEPAALERLRAEAVARPRRTWDDYADELWATVVAGAR